MVARGGFEPPKPLGRQIYSLLHLTTLQPRHAALRQATQHEPAGVCRTPRTRVGAPRCALLVWDESFPRPAARKVIRGAGEGIRTPDRLITNQLLYLLSYASQPDKTMVIAQPVPPRNLSADTSIVRHRRPTLQWSLAPSNAPRLASHPDPPGDAYVREPPPGGNPASSHESYLSCHPISRPRVSLAAGATLLPVPAPGHPWPWRGVGDAPRTGRCRPTPTH